MILEATYTGPFAKVQIPGFEHKVAKRGETVKLRVQPGFPVGGCWDITKGKKEYEAGLKKMEDDRRKVEEARKARAEKAAAEANEKIDRAIEAADAAEVPATRDTKPDKKGK